MKGFQTIKKIYVILVLFMFVKPVSFAAEKQGEQEGTVDFHYQNILPENQLREGDFFDLLVEPGQKQILETEVVNEGDEELTVLVSINDATTNGMGVIEYGNNNLAHTADFTYKLSDMLTGPQEITLEPHETKKIKYQLEIPKKKIPGMILGGIELQKKETGNQSSKGVSVRSEFVYTFSVSLQMSEEKIKPEFSFNDVVFNEELITVSINNDQPKLVKGVQVEGTVTSQKSSKILSEFNLKDAKMAPLTVMNIPIELNGYDAGDYRVKTTIKYEEQVWEADQEFTISAEVTETSEIYAKPIPKKKKQSNWLLISGLFIVAVVIVYLLIRR